MWGGGRDAAALLDEPAATLLAGALRANNTLTVLQLAAVQFWDNAAAASTLMGALTAHPSLRTLSLRFNEMQDADRAAAGATLGALLAANAPALIELDVSFCLLRDAGMAPLFEALPANTHLRTLRCSGNGITEAFVAAVLLPAVRANACLRILETAGGGGNWPGEREAEEIVNRRADAR
jgi:Ran GTPase-activating protein (RanGAP) involved in mRNA processing and transport